MNLDEKATMFRDDLMNFFIDEKDFCFCNALNKNLTPGERQRQRNAFIDGLAWSSNLAASCIVHPAEPQNLVIVDKLLKYWESLNTVNGVDGRLARTYRTQGGDTWLASNTMQGYFYKDGQAKAGPIGFASAAAAAYRSTILPEATRRGILNLYLNMVRDFKKNDYKIMTAKGEVSEHGNMSLSWPAGLINAHFVAAILGVGSLAAKALGDAKESDDLEHWAKRANESGLEADTVVWCWVKAMGAWDWLMRKFGSHRQKFSNDNLIYQLFSIWAHAPEEGLFGGEARKDMVKAAEIMYDMTEDWQNPFFDCIYVKLTEKKFHFSLDKIQQDLLAFSDERRKASKKELSVGKDIVPIGERKPSSWAWRQNPYEIYEGKEFANEWYNPADFLTAYNLYKYVSM